MDNLKVFENDEFGQLSVIVKNNKEYIEAIRRNMRGTLNNISIKEKDGSITDLGKKYGGIKDTQS